MTAFFVEGVPAPQGSKNAFPIKGRCVLVESSKKVEPWRRQVAAEAKKHFDKPLDGAITLRVAFLMPRTKAMKDKPAPPMVQRPDLDKLLRSLCDGLTGHAFEDDSQVVRIEADKRRAKPGEGTGARVEVLAHD